MAIVMTMTPAEVERKVRQLDNDVESIYELLNRISITQQRHGNRVGELTEMVAAHDARFDSMGQRLDSMDGRLGRIETGLETVLAILRGQSSAQ